MIRETIIVKKTEVFEFLEDSKVSKIEIKREANQRDDDTVIKIHIYRHASKKLFNNFKTNLAGVVKKKNTDNNWLSLENRDYLAGLVSAKYLSKRCVERLLEIEKQEDINLSIPHAYRKT